MDKAIFFSLMKAFLLVLSGGFLDLLLTLGIATELSGALDTIELGKGGLPVTLKGVEYL